MAKRKRGRPRKKDSKKIKRKRKREVRKFVKSLDIKVPRHLQQFLSKDQQNVLKCYLARCGINETASGLNISRHDVLEEYINLGRALGFYYLLEKELVPEMTNSGTYMDGWSDCRNYIWRLINNDKKRWKALKAGDTRT